jgi:hypothetical protein
MRLLFYRAVSTGCGIKWIPGGADEADAKPAPDLGGLQRQDVVAVHRAAGASLWFGDRQGELMHHDSDGKKRFRLKVRHVILGVFGVLLLVAAVHMAVLSSGANRRLEALRAAGQPTSVAEWVLRNKLPMGMENAAPLYQNAIAAFVKPPEDVNLPFIGRKTVSLARGAAFPEPMAKAVADYLAVNEKCLALLHEAAGIENCRYEYEHGRVSAPFSDLRSCAQLLKLAAVNHACNGDSDAAVACVKDTLSLGDSLRNEPMLISYLVQNAYAALGVTSIERALSLTTFTDSQLKDLDGALAVTGGRIDLAHAMASERCGVIDDIRNPALREETRGLAWILRFPGVRSQGLIDVLDYMEDCIQAADLRGPQRETRFKEIEAHFFGLSSLHIVAKVMAPALMRISQLDSRVRAHLDLGRTALAIERYRLARGAQPNQLADLVPTYLDQVPTDPFDDQSIRYRRTEPGYILWSIMDDGQDNGGKERDDVGKGEPYDLCFIVTR